MASYIPPEQVLKVLKTERNCIQRQQCDRDCAKCDLVMDSDEILQVYNYLITEYEFKADRL